MTVNQEIPASELRLGDIVRVYPTDAFHDAIVRKVEEEWVTLYRPYATNADFSCTSGVICYVGIEEYQIRRDNRPIFVYRRQVLK